MLRSIKIFILLAIPLMGYSQDTTDWYRVYNFVNGIQIDSVEIKQITFYNDDSLRIISGNNDTIMVGGTSSGGVSSETDPVYSGDSADIIFAEDTASMLSSYSKQKALEDSISALNSTISSIQAVNNSLRDTIQAFNTDSGKVSVRIFAGDTSNYPTPDFATQRFWDSANNDEYKAIGTSRGDWRLTHDLIVWLACFFRIRRKYKKV